MIVAIHQPNYLPWLGYLQKMQAADVFVYLDHVQFTQGYTQRVQVLSQGRPAWLTVPVRTGGAGPQPIDAVRFDERGPWRAKHLRTLQGAYGRHPHFSAVFPVVEEVFAGEHETLAALNVALLERMAGELGMTCRRVRSRDLPLDGLARNAMLARIVREVGGTVYLHGKGGGEYQEPEAFAAEGVTLRPQAFVHPVHAQKGSETFVPGLTSLDALFNLGWAETRALLAAARPADAGTA